MKARVISMMVLAASLFAVSQVWAQSDGSLTVGGGFWTQSNPEAKWTEYNAVPRGAFLGDYVLRQFNGQLAGAVWGSAPDRHDQSNSMYLAKGVRWRLDADFNASPHNFSNVARTPYAENTKGVFTLPDSLQRLIQNGVTGTNATVQNAYLRDLLNSTGHGVALGLNTDVTTARLRARPMKGWQFELRGSDRERNGSQALGATMGGPGGPTVELPAPIDQRTIDVDASGSYVHGPARVMVSAGMSSFHNRLTSIQFDHFRVFNTGYARSTKNQMSVAPDNDQIRGRVVASWQLPYASLFTATIGVSQTNQKQDFLPMTVNDTILYRSSVGTDSTKLERGNLEGKVTEIVQDYRLTGHPIANFHGTLRFRQEKLDDKTPVMAFPYGVVNYDQTWSRTPAESEGDSHTKTVFGFDGDYELARQASVSVLYEHRMRDLPEWREVVKDAENVFGAKLHTRPMDGVEASVGYTMGQRRMDEFELHAYEGGEWPTFRRYDVADRDQSKVDGELSYSGIEWFDASVSVWWNKDDYPNSDFGLQSVDNTQFLGEGTWHVNKTVDLTGGFGYGQQKATQSSIEQPNAGVSDTAGVAPWTAAFTDKNAYAFAKLEWWAKPKKMQVTGEYTFIRDMLVYDFSHYFKRSAAGLIPANVASTTAINLPSAFNRTSDVVLATNWRYTPQFQIGCSYGYTKYDISDALLQNIAYVNANPTNTTSAASAIFLGNNRMSFYAHRFKVTATRRF